MRVALRFLAARLQSAALTVLGAVLLFLLVRLVPGDLAFVMLGPRTTPELRARIEGEMGLDRSLPEQAWVFLSHAATGDLGTDVVSRRPILDVVLDALPYTLALAGAAMALSLALGIPLGVLAATRRGSWIDAALSLVTVAFITTPSLVVSILLLLVRAHPARLRRSRAAHRRGLRPAPRAGPRGRGPGPGEMIGGAVFAELVFARPGLGSLVVTAIGSRDYPVVQACVLVIVVVHVTANLLADLVNAALDPRVARSLMGGAGR